MHIKGLFLTNRVVLEIVFRMVLLELIPCSFVFSFSPSRLLWTGELRHSKINNLTVVQFVINFMI